MRFKPKSEEEIQSENIIDPGQYQFEIIEASDKKSKSGNDMIELKLKIWDIHGSERIIFDYLLEAMSFKLRHFCESTGLINKYNDGSLLAYDCLGKCGIVDLIVQKDKNGQYAPKNAVKDYLVKEKTSLPKTEVIEEFKDDDIPF